jgi:hypothetical protein
VIRGLHCIGRRIRRRIYINRFVVSEKKGKDIPSFVKAALATILTKKIICFGNW